MIHDAVIVGGGPAGLSAAIWLARYLHDVVLIDSGDPRNWETRGVNGYLGHLHIRPAELRRLGREECRRYGGTLVDGCVDRAVGRSDDCFELGLDNGDRYRARRLLLAFGIRDAWPRIPGLGRVYGETAHVCPDCDGYESRGSRVVVVGNGRRAAGMALSLTTWTQHITICTHGEAPRLEPDLLAKIEALGIPILTDPVARVHEQGGKLTRLELDGGAQVACDRLFFSIAQYPSDDLGVQLGCDRDDDGQIIIDPHGHTSVLNVFAAGDIVPGPQLAITAAAGGAVAAMAIHKSLVPEGRKP